MKALAVNGSPRKGGNTETLLNRVLEPLNAAGWTTELIQIGASDIHGCRACYKCWDKKDMACAFKKDSFNAVMSKVVAADALIVGSPTYFTDVTAETKGFLDRAGMVGLANDRALRGKIGAAVVAVRRAGATHVFDTINHMFLMSQLIIPGSTYWNLGIGMDKGDVRQDDEGLGNMQNLGETIAWLGNAIQPHKESFPRA